VYGQSLRNENKNEDLASTGLPVALPENPLATDGVGGNSSEFKMDSQGNVTNRDAGLGGRQSPKIHINALVTELRQDKNLEAKNLSRKTSKSIVPKSISGRT